MKNGITEKNTAGYAGRNKKTKVLGGDMIPRRALPAIVFVALLMILVGCMHTSTYRPVGTLQPKADAGQMEVLLRNGAIYQLNGCSVGATSIAGLGWKYSLGNVTWFDGSIPLSEIALVKTTGRDNLSSLLLYGAIGVMIGTTIAATTDDEGLKINALVTYPYTGWSCPYVFSYDGREYHFESETFAGAVCRGLERQTVEPLRHLRAVDGGYRLAVVNQSLESQHVNAIGLLAVDHPLGTTVLPDARGDLHTVREARPPSRAVDLDGADVTGQVAALDDRVWESARIHGDLALDRNLRDGIICAFPRPESSRAAKLIIVGRDTYLAVFAVGELFSLCGPNRMAWYHALNTDPQERAKVLSWMMREGGLQISVWDGQTWVGKGWLPDVGPRATNQRVAPMDLTGVGGDTVIVRIESATDLWLIDQVTIDFSPDEPIQVTPVALRSAITDHQDTISARLATVDSTYYATLPGDHAILSFAEIPVVPEMERSYLLTSSGYYYSWAPDGISDQRAALEKILAEPLLGNRRYLPEWRKVRNEHAQAYRVTPSFPATTAIIDGTTPGR
jgi:hypothetical protein